MGRLGAFLLGGVVGAGVALFFAPRTGEETRALIADKADEYWGKGQVWTEKSKVYIQEGVASVQPTISKKGDELRQKIENARTLIAEQVAKNASAARDAINDKVPVAAEKLNQAADVVRGHIDNAAEKIKARGAGGAGEAAESTAEAVVAEAGAVATEAAAVVADAAAPVVADIAAAVNTVAPDKVEPATIPFEAQ